MNAKTARIVSFVLSTTGMLFAMVSFVSKNKEATKPFLYTGGVLMIASLFFRSLIRFKPELFNNKPSREELEAKEFDETK
jgi:hypothetical protein